MELQQEKSLGDRYKASEKELDQDSGSMLQDLNRKTQRDLDLKDFFTKHQ